MLPSEVYPRVCGGTYNTRRAAVRNEGLSPRCAGEPFGAAIPGPEPRVYPRVCGGTASQAFQSGTLSGLSPRVRGNPGKLDNLLITDRSIPACAGEPTEYQRSSHSGEVYPRVCGGTPTVEQGSRRVYGLSPRVRGNR